MERQRNRARRLVGSAAVACTACRRLKMRCVGAATPPCQRCLKAGRRCDTPELLAVASEHHGHTAASGSLGGSQSRPPRSDPVSIDLTNTAASASLSSIPTVYNSSALDAVQSLPEYTASDDCESPRSRANLSAGGWPSEYGTPLLHHTVSLIAERKILDLASFFWERQRHILPILFDEDSRHLGASSQLSPLTYCMAYVAALYAPGQQHQAERLLPEVLVVVRSRQTLTRERTEDAWTVLQALAVLYTWAPASNRPSETTVHELMALEIKAAIESTALRLGLHLAVEAVANCIDKGSQGLLSLPDLKLYLFWLWLYAVSQRYSLLTHTPPTIREDRTIQLALPLLGSLIEQENIRHILVEVDLCSLWSHTGSQQMRMNEWWCPMLSNHYSTPSLTHLEDVNSAFEEWSRRWSVEGYPGSIFHGAPPTFNYRFARFCISTYATSIALHNSAAGSASEAIKMEVFRQSLIAASKFCGTLLDLPPSAAEYLRYLPETSFLKITMVCGYILHSLSGHITEPAARTEYIALVRRILDLMSDVTTERQSFAAKCARYICAQINNLEQKYSVPDPSCGDASRTSDDIRALPEAHDPTSEANGNFSRELSFDFDFFIAGL